MTGHVQVEQAALISYGNQAAAKAEQLVTAAAVDQAALVSAVIPVFGLIGQEFLAAFARAQLNHLTTVSEIAAVHAGSSATAYEAAGVYQSTEQASTATFG